MGLGSGLDGVVAWVPDTHDAPPPPCCSSISLSKHTDLSRCFLPQLLYCHASFFLHNLASFSFLFQIALVLFATPFLVILNAHDMGAVKQQGNTWLWYHACSLHVFVLYGTELYVNVHHMHGALH
jgi:hypothetical protein